MQEAFLATWRHAGTYAGSGSARAWLFTVARHSAARLFRRRVGEPSELASIEDLGVDAGWGQVPEPDLLLDRLSNREILERALATLPAAERETLVLRDLESLSGEQVAELTGVSLAAMKSRLHRARLRFAAAVRELNDG